MLLLLALGFTLLYLLYWFSQPFRDLVFEYYWGPILADARDEPVRGVLEGYNPLNTLTYGLVLMLGGLALYRLLMALRVDLDQKLVLATLPLLVLGGLARSLEDTGLFREPLVFYFIAPLIYLTLALGAVAVLLLGCGLRAAVRRWGNRTSALWALLAGLGFLLFYLGLWSFEYDGLAHLVHPLDVALLMTALILGGYWAFGSRPLREPALLLGLGGLFTVGLSLFWAAAFVREPWHPADPHPAILKEVLGYWASALLVTVALLLALRRLRPELAVTLRPFLSPLGLALYGAHYLDGTATYLGIEGYGYTEKHVLPDLLIGLTGTALIMLPLKALVVTVVIYYLDVAYQKEARTHRELFLLVKLLVITLGLAPGVRDIARIYLGV